jgi:hypothetical protein
MSACGVCGTDAPPKFRPPRPMQPPDLDGRPGEPTRSTLDRWVATCKRCGASAPDLSSLPESAGDTVRSDSYRALRTPGPAMPHLRWALIARRAGDTREAAEATLAGAWALEDAGQQAAPLRRDAASLFNPAAGPAETLRVIDILRRASAFAEASALADALSTPDEAGETLLAFERARIAVQDSGRHQISAALRPPSHRPHVSHGRPAKGGFFSNFLRRS